MSWLRYLLAHLPGIGRHERPSPYQRRGSKDRSGSRSPASKRKARNRRREAIAKASRRRNRK